MPDIPVAGGGGSPYNPDMEARLSRLEEDMREVKATNTRLEAAVIRIEAMLTATLPHLATKAEVVQLRADTVAGFADKPGKTYMWGILAVLLTAYGLGLASIAVLAK
jgi:hypothetical protein